MDNPKKFKYRWFAAKACLRGKAVLYNARIVADPEGGLLITAIDPLAESPTMTSCEIHARSVQIGEDSFSRAAREMHIEHGRHSEEDE